MSSMNSNSPLGRNKLIECVNSPSKKDKSKYRKQWQQQQYQPTKLNKKNDDDQLTLNDDLWTTSSAQVILPKPSKQPNSTRPNRRHKSYGRTNTQAITTTSQQNNKTEKQQHSNNNKKKRPRAASSHHNQQLDTTSKAAVSIAVSTNDGANNSDITTSKKKRARRYDTKTKLYHRAVEEQLRKYLYEQLPPSHYNAEQRLQHLLDLYKIWGLSYGNNRQAYNEILSHSTVREWENYAPTNIGWSTRVLTVLNLLEVEVARQGLWMLFGDNTIHTLESLYNMKAYKPVPNHYGDFNKKESHTIAIRKIKKALQKVVDAESESELEIKDILFDRSIKKFIKEFNSKEGLAKLEALSEERAKKMAADVDLDSKITGSRKKREHRRKLFIRRMASLLFITSTNIIVFYNDIVTCLDKGLAGHFPSLDDEDHIFVILTKEIYMQMCIGGGTVRHGREPHEFEQVLSSDEHRDYAVELCFHSEKPIIIDLNSSIGNEDEGGKYKRTHINGTGKCARRVKVTRCDPDSTTYNQTTYEVKTRKDDDKSGQKDRKNWKLHRLQNIILDNMGLGFKNSKLVRDYLELKDGETFENVDRFKWSTNDEEYLKKRVAYLKRKGWEGVPLADCSDIDHTVGRSCGWMNSTLFTLACSHSWNQCMSYLRILFGDWGFASLDKAYGTGND